VPLALSGKDTWCIAVFSAYLSNRIGGNEPFDAIVNGGGDWTEDCFVQSGELVRELYDLGYFQETCLGDSNDNATSYVKSGKAAMLVMGSWAISQLEARILWFRAKWAYLPSRS
jgi:raffinose/stachyose/melibiose transport system substrate-binding protein